MNALSLKPRMSEKAYASSVAQNTYVFVVPMDANKASVTTAVTEQFGVQVIDVRLVIVKGKAKQAYRKRQRPVAGKRADIKKAYVRVKAGDTIDIFGEEKKADKKSAKAKKEAK